MVMDFNLSGFKNALDAERQKAAKVAKLNALFKRQSEISVQLSNVCESMEKIYEAFLEKIDKDYTKLQGLTDELADISDEISEQTNPSTFRSSASKSESTNKASHIGRRGRIPGFESL